MLSCYHFFRNFSTKITLTILCYNFIWHRQTGFTRKVRSIPFWWWYTGMYLW